MRSPAEPSNSSRDCATLDKHLHANLTERLRRVPHARVLGVELVGFDESYCELKIPYDERLVGDPDTGVIHGGAVTALLDNVAGVIAWASSGGPGGTAVATLDMRIDYLGSATPGRELHVRAECYRRTANVAFVRGQAFHDSPEQPIAICTAAFMVGTPNTPLPASAP